MAKTIQQLEEELSKVSGDTRRAYDILHGTAAQNNPGLYRELSSAKNTLKKKGLFESAKVQAENAIKTLEPQIKAAEAEYKKFQDQKNALDKELKASKTAEQEKKTNAATAKGAANVYADALDELDKAELGLEGYKGNEKYIAAYTKAQQAYETLTKSGAAPTVALPIPKIVIPPVNSTDGNVGKDGKPVKEPTITEFINTITDPKNKQLLIDVQKDLKKNFGYPGPIDGSPSTSFLPALQKAYTDRAGLPQAWQGTDFRSFLTNPNVAGFASAGSAGVGGSRPYTTISSESQAKSAINQIFQSELRRDATAAEFKKLYPELIKAQAANPSKQKVVNGVTQTITGLDVGQWITEKAQALPEYAVKKAEKTGGTKEDLTATLNANGLPVDDMQLDEWVKQVQNGSSIDAIKRSIRNIASIGQPESIKKMIAEGSDLATVYAPYKSAMAGALEIPVNSIKLDDPTLRMAIGPDKEMSIYDFQKALRQDQRWQYTDQARSEASDVATKVLKDFGFMG
jgi:hypothetical protein